MLDECYANAGWRSYERYMSIILALDDRYMSIILVLDDSHMNVIWVLHQN